MVTPFWILSTGQKLLHATVNIPTMFHEVWWKKSKHFKNPLFSVSMATAAKFVLPIPYFLAYLVPLDVDVTGNITAKICEAWSEFNIFCTLVTMATVTILNLFQPPKSCHTLRWIFLQSFMKFDERNPIFFNPPPFCFHGNCGKVCPTDSDFLDLSRSTRCGCCSYQVSSISDIPTKFHEVWWKETNFFLNRLFFVSIAAAAKFVLPIPFFFAYLIPLDVDVVPIKFHQFLFGE